MMKFLRIILALVSFILIVQSVKVSVYYEALCYDSTRFIALQLYPSYRHLKDHIQLDLVPYGKATHNLVKGKWQFECQHGREECKGNKYQACALAQNNGQDKDLAFVHCVMRESNPANVQKMERCANQAGINWNNITNCALSVKGDKLLAANGDKTYSLEPSISFVPTIVYDDKYSSYLQSVSIGNFASVVCDKINGMKPIFCHGKRLPERRSYFPDYNIFDY